MTSLSALAVAAVLGSRLVAADITGVVREESTGEPIAGAVISLDDLGRSALTAEDGSYRFAEVPPGPQHLSVRLLGFQSRSLHVLVPAAGALRVDLVLRTDPIEVDAVVVRSLIPIRGVDIEGPDLDPTRRISGAAIRNDPFSAEPDVIEALVGGAVSNTPESGGGLHVRGGDGDEVGYLLDGIPVFSPYHSGVRSGAWNPDAVSRVELRTDPALAVDGLAGVVLASTIEPGDRFRTRGELSTSQLGVNLDGPIPGGGGFLLAGRTGYPGLIRPPDEPSYLDGADHDVLAKLEIPVSGRELRFLAFDNRNVVEASSRPSEVGNISTDPGDPNRYVWHGRSFGLQWAGPARAGARPSIQAWRASLDASLAWNSEELGFTRVTSDRTQYGLLGSLEWTGPKGTAEIGLRAIRDRLAYEVVAADATPSVGERNGEVDELGAFASVVRSLGERVKLSSSVLARTGSGEGRILPRLGMEIRVGESAVVYAEYARTAQPVQSLRNAESVVGRIFPADLYAGGAGIPTARAHNGALGVVMIPWAGARVDLETYARSLDALAVLDPQDGKPFSSAGIRQGSGSVVGGSAEMSVSAARYAASASLGMERVEVRVGGEEWTPGYAASRSARVGAIAFPTPTLSIRVGWIGQFGRRGSDAIGLLEWESCNLLDMGCEFAGSPEELGELGARRLPAYHRLDLSVRKHWHFVLAGREVSLEAYTTASNLLGRANVLAFVVDPSTGEGAPIEMRPRAPLTLGLGWTF